jgi:hypothetical protein
MNNPDQNTRLIEELLDRYQFVRPVPEDVRQEILSSKKKNLVRDLKTVGSFSALHGVLLTLYFGLKKLGVGIPVTKFIISGLTVASLSYGGYYAATSLHSTAVPEKQVVKDVSRLQEAGRARYRWVDQITLYNGSVIEGAIMSRGGQYKVLTATGVTYIPRNRIKMVKPLKVGADVKVERPGPAAPMTR